MQDIVQIANGEAEEGEEERGGDVDDRSLFADIKPG